jgi:hypothetical protein
LPSARAAGSEDGLGTGDLERDLARGQPSAGLLLAIRDDVALPGGVAGADWPCQQFPPNVAAPASL